MKRMQYLALIAVVVGLFACSNAREYHKIELLPRPWQEATIQNSDIRGSSSYNVSESRYVSLERKFTQRDGVWLTRYVYAPRGNGLSKAVELVGIEILFCPERDKDYTKCRVGTLWSRDNNPLGQTYGGSESRSPAPKKSVLTPKNESGPETETDTDAK